MSAIQQCHHRGVCSQRSNRDVQPTREQFEFVLVAEEKQDEETQDGDDGQHGDDNAGGRRPCKTQTEKSVTRFLLYQISCAARSTFFSLCLASHQIHVVHTLRRPRRCPAGFLFCLQPCSFVEEPPELELKAKLARP